MDFFEAQARAKKRTSRLVVLFSLAVAGTVIAGYFFAVSGLRAANGYRPRHSSRRGYQVEAAAAGAPLSWWQPKVLAGVGLGALAVIGLASLYKWNEFASGGAAVAESVGGRRVDPHTTDLAERRLLNVVEEMAIASGIPVPAVYVLDDEPALNAFAAGLTTSDAIVAVTRGTLQKLTRDELQGVIGHEFSHILNGDMRLNMRLTAIIFGILVLGIAGRGILWSLRGARFNSRGKNGGGAIAAIALAGIALLIIGYVGYFFGRLIQAAVSRQREFLADASSVQFTRNPGGLTGALRKIGGYALGSSLESTKSAAIGHFFFAQGFTSMFGGLWATHPPLPERIRAIDPQFDGQMFDPPEVVDVTKASFAAAGFAPGATKNSAKFSVPDRPPSRIPPVVHPIQAIASIGTLSAGQIANAQVLLDATPAALRAAARTPPGAAVLLYGLLLDYTNPAVGAKQRALVASRAGADALRRLDELDPALRAVQSEQRLPLLQLALPALRTLEPSALSPFLDTLDELVHADAHVSTFEFALQKILIRTLALGRKPDAAVIQIYSFHAVIEEISIVLSALAHASSNVGLDAATAFAAGTAQLKLVETQLPFRELPDCDLTALDAALDTLAVSSGPIKQRTLLAAAHVVGADGQILVAEAELLRAIAAALDCPMPPLTPVA